MTWEQAKGVLDRLIALLLLWLVSGGYLTEGDAATVGTILIGLASLAWGWWANRPKALVQSAATVPSTTVITTPALAADTPEPNIVSAASNVVRKVEP